MAMYRTVRYEAEGLYAQMNSNIWLVAPMGVEFPPSVLREVRQEVHPSSSCTCAKCMTRRRMRQETPSFLIGEDPDNLSPSYREMIFYKKLDDNQEKELLRQLDNICSVNIVRPGDADRERNIYQRQNTLQEARMAREAEMMQRRIEAEQEAERNFRASTPTRVRADGVRPIRRAPDSPWVTRLLGLSDIELPDPPREEKKKEKPKVEKVVKGRRIRTRPAEE